MLMRSQFDTMFTDKFFIKPSKKNQNMTILNNFPSTIHHYKIFILSPDGKQLRNKFIQQILLLKKWAQDKNISSSLLDVFINNINNDYYALSAFVLFKEGYPLFVELINLIHSQKIPLNKVKTVIKNLIPELQMCANGVYKYIFNAYLALSNNCELSLMQARMHFAEQVIQESIHDDVSMDQIIGSHIHYTNAVLNYFSAQIGIEEVADDLAPQDEESIFPFANDFIEKFPKTMTAEAIIDHLVAQINLFALAEKIKKHPHLMNEYIQNLLDQINKYGEDKTFLINNILQEDENMTGIFTLSDNAHHYLWLSIYKRLQNNHYLNMPNKILEGKREIYYFPDHSIKFSYVINEDKSIKPLMIHFLEQWQKGLYQIGKLTTKQQVEIKEEMIKLFKHKLHFLLPDSRLENNIRLLISFSDEMTLDLYCKILFILPMFFLEKFFAEFSEDFFEFDEIDAQDLLNFIKEFFYKEYLIQDLNNQLLEFASTPDNLYLILELISLEKRIIFLRQIDHNQLANHFFPIIFKLLPLLPANDINLFLSRFEQNALTHLFDTVEKLTEILILLPYAQWSYFIKGLIGLSHLKTLLSTPENLNYVISKIPSKLPFLWYVPCELIESLLQTTQQLENFLILFDSKDYTYIFLKLSPIIVKNAFKNPQLIYHFLSILPSDHHSHFLKSFANLLTDEDLEKYRDAQLLYHELNSYRTNAHSRANPSSALSSFFGRFFATTAAQPHPLTEIIIDSPTPSRRIVHA